MTDLQPTGLVFGVVQFLLWMIQHANNNSVVQCNVSPVMGWVRHRYNTEHDRGNMALKYQDAANLDCNIGCLQFSLYHALVATVPA